MCAITDFLRPLFPPSSALSFVFISFNWLRACTRAFSQVQQRARRAHRGSELRITELQSRARARGTHEQLSEFPAKRAGIYIRRGIYRKRRIYGIKGGGRENFVVVLLFSGDLTRETGSAALRYPGERPREVRRGSEQFGREEAQSFILPSYSSLPPPLSRSPR